MAHVEDHAFAADKSTRRHLLKTVCIDGTQDDALFVRPGGALWVRWGGLWRDSGCAPPAGPAGALQNS